MLDKTITSALCQLRLQLIRSGTALTHVDALLAQRGIDPAGLHVPRRYPADSCKHGEIRLMMLTALRSGPKSGAEFVAALQARHPAMTPEVAKRRVWRAMSKMGEAGFAVRGGGVWWLAQPAVC